MMSKKQITMWAMVVLVFAVVFHIGMMKDQNSLCDRGAMYGKECQD